ncbi:unnamed protein product [Timema podura]|uniref:Choline kinase n=1 Tax=Timema podura TaxID=61482 RepID=A0ABN7NND6_TIMPD|nr:unnamed protein product [Timema podura]
MISRGGTTLTDSWYIVKEVTELNAVQSTVDRIYHGSSNILTFLRSYLHHTCKEQPQSNLHQNHSLMQEQEAKLLKEVHSFTLASHLFWGLWAIVNARHSRISFGYWDYALERLESYFNIKNEMVLKSNSSLLLTDHKVPDVMRAIQKKEG